MPVCHAILTRIVGSGQALVVWSLVSSCRYSIPLVVRSPLRPKARRSPGQGASSSPSPESPAHASTFARSCCACAPAGGSAFLRWTHQPPPPLTSLKTPKRSVAFQFSTTVQLHNHTPRTAASASLLFLASSLDRLDASAARIAVHVSFVRRRGNRCS
jgi:hypothetical protein